MKRNKISLIFLGIGLFFISFGAKAASAHDACTGPNTVSKHIEIFDDLDFNVYSNQKWDELKKSHSNDILVHYPDGHITKGLNDHIIELKKSFIFAPDSRITSHPVKIGAGEWTSVIGVLEATFSKPLPLGAEKVMSPTGKKVKMQMVTIGHWNKDCVMDEEYLFYDNAEFAKQMGMNM